jgi:hypothetical protein
MWKDKTAGYVGALKQTQEAAAKKEAELNAKLQEAQALLESYQAGADSYKQQLEQVPALQKQLQELQSEAALASKLRIMTEFPALLQVRVKEEVPGAEGEEPTEHSYNPILRLIETSSLAGDELRAEMGRLNQVYSAQSTTTEPAAPLQPIAPTPAQPVDTEGTLEYWRAKAMEYHEAMVGGDLSQETREGSAEAWKQVRKLEARRTASD